MFQSAGGSLSPANLAGATAAGRAERAEREVARLTCDVERLLMIAEALWTMVREQHGYTGEELFRRVMEIDLRDGRADGKVARGAPEPCPSCGRLNRPGRPLCLYCGKARVVNPFDR